MDTTEFAMAIESELKKVNESFYIEEDSSTPKLSLRANFRLSYPILFANEDEEFNISSVYQARDVFLEAIKGKLLNLNIDKWKAKTERIELSEEEFISALEDKL